MGLEWNVGWGMRFPGWVWVVLALCGVVGVWGCQVPKAVALPPLMATITRKMMSSVCFMRRSGEG